jgi:hypothetical protein
MLTYTLNVIAIRNLEYKSYYQRNMTKRLQSIEEKYRDLSAWINQYFHNWLIFAPVLVEKDEI